MTTDYALEANDWEDADQDREYLDDDETLTAAQLEAIMAEMPERDGYTDADLEAIEADFLSRHGHAA